MRCRLLFSVDVKVSRLLIPYSEQVFFRSLTRDLPVSSVSHVYLDVHARVGVEDLADILDQLADTFLDLASAQNEAWVKRRVHLGTEL